MQEQVFSFAAEHWNQLMANLGSAMPYPTYRYFLWKESFARIPAPYNAEFLIACLNSYWLERDQYRYPDQVGLALVLAFIGYDSEKPDDCQYGVEQLQSWQQELGIDFGGLPMMRHLMCAGRPEFKFESGSPDGLRLRQTVQRFIIHRLEAQSEPGVIHLGKVKALCGQELADARLSIYPANGSVNCARCVKKSRALPT